MSSNDNYSTSVKYFSLSSELDIRQIELIPELILKYYIKDTKDSQQILKYELRSHQGYNYLFYSVLYPSREFQSQVDIMIAPGNPIKITMWSSNQRIPQKFLRNLYEDIVIVVQLIEEKLKKMNFYSMFVPGMPPLDQSRKSSHSNILTDSQTSFFILAILINSILFLIIGEYSYFVIIGFIFFTSLLSGRIMAMKKPWKIDIERQEVHLVKISLLSEEYKQYAKIYTKSRFSINKAIYESSIKENIPITKEKIFQILQEHGIYIHLDAVNIRYVNLYEIVKNVSEKFGIKIPKIILIPTMIPNAAASGPTSGLGVILISGGLLFQMDTAEIEAIIGHELSHLKAHDPLVMISLSTLLMASQFLLWTSINQIGIFELFFSYMLISSVIFMFGKFLEARADLDAALVLGESKNLSSGLRKIGYIRLLPLRKKFFGKRVNLSEWFYPDPHPPLAYRIDRLDEMDFNENINHTFIRSIKDVITAIVKN
ncbi:MAG: M48 family metallopeptidase [Candidatus Ranarchaeia archaeon]